MSEESGEEEVRRLAAGMGLSLWKLEDGTYSLVWDDTHTTHTSGMTLEEVEGELEEIPYSY